MSNIYIRRKHSFVEEASNFESVRSHLAGELCETGKVSDSIKSDLVGIRESFCKMEENITK